MKEVNAPNCGRENDLVAFLYGELNDDEAKTFRRHLNDCVACNAEAASLRDVRQSVVAWRNESLGGYFVPVPAMDSSPTRLDGAKPSAIAALREFFNLAPLWMKGAVAFASVLFCLFAGLAVARLRTVPPAVVAETPGKTVSSEEQVNATVQRRVQAELAQIKNSTAAPPDSVVAGKKTSNRNSAQRVTTHTEVVSNNPTQKARRPLSKTEREQLASDLRLVSARNDGEVDLLDDGINQ
jgi:anti-sigma factor RsiW